jgi:hypothetical protein
MTGASLALIVIPIVSTAGLMVWLMMVFSADGHPKQAHRNAAVTPTSIPGKTAECLPSVAATANRSIEAAASGATAGQFRPAA